jgi:hypothetical protein
VDDPPHGADGSRIETPFLQLVMSRLWEAEGAGTGGGNSLRLATLDRLGGAERIVRTHLDTAMASLPPAEQDAAADVFHYLVTSTGAKIAHTADDLSDYSRRPEHELRPMLEKLSSGEIRILRPLAPPLDQPGAPRYEIFHDVLAPAVLDWRARHVQAMERAHTDAELSRARRRVNRLRLGVAALSLLLILMVGLAAYAFQQRAAAGRARNEATARGAEARAQQQLALSRELAATGLNVVRDDPLLALLLAARAAEITPTTQAEEALRKLLVGAPLRAVMRGHTDLLYTTAFSPDGRYLLTASAEFVHWLNETWGAAVFTDIGDAADTPKAWNGNPSYGVGARFKTPAGPFAIDLAYAHDPRKFRLAFSVTVAF